MGKTAVYRLGWVIFVLSLPVLLFTTNLRLAVNSYALYRYGLERHGAVERLGVGAEEVRNAVRELIAYWGSPAAEVQIKLKRSGEEIELFNVKEIAHLRDVKRLMALNRRFQEVALAYGIAFSGLSLFFRRSQLWAGLRWGGGLTLGLLGALGLGMALSFDRLFLLFHILSFPNLLWVLDPATDRLIQMFPQGFFQEAALLIAGATAVEGAALWATGLWLRRRATRR